MSDGLPHTQRLLDIMRTLRSPNGCPWDREQTLDSLKPYLVEECYEALDAIDARDPSQLREELGDILLQIVFQAEICGEAGSFTFEDVARTIADKLVRRHPHVFGDRTVTGADEVVRNWDAIKREEKAERKKPDSVLSGVPRALPALHRALEVQKRAARVGFDWKDVPPVLDKISEEIAELKEALASGHTDHVREEIGDLLFSIVNLARFLKIQPEEALQKTTAKFVRRFQEIERRLAAAGRKVEDCQLDELDAHWDQVKTDERSPTPKPDEQP